MAGINENLTARSHRGDDGQRYARTLETDTSGRCLQAY